MLCLDSYKLFDLIVIRNRCKIVGKIPYIDYKLEVSIAKTNIYIFVCLDNSFIFVVLVVYNADQEDR